MGEFRRRKHRRFAPVVVGMLAVLPAALPAGGTGSAPPAMADAEPVEEAPEDPDGSWEDEPDGSWEEAPEEWEDPPEDSWEEYPEESDPPAGETPDEEVEEPVDVEPTENSVTLVSAGAWAAGGGSLAREWDDLNARITMSGDDSQVTVDVAGGTHDEYLTLAFAAPEGRSLEVGTYDRPQRMSYGGDRAGMAISGGGYGCDAVRGRFEVKALTRSADGVESIWLLYEEQCEGGSDARFGELRIRQPLASAALLMAPRAIAWPEVERGASGAVVPVVVRNFSDAAVDVGAGTIGGTDSAAFVIRADDCAGRVLGPGDGCEVHLRLVSQEGSNRDLAASLAVPNSVDPAALSVQLSARVAPGRTAWTMRSDPGDWVGGGRSYSFTAADSEIAVVGSRSGVRAGVRGHGSYFTGSFLPAPGDVIAPGRYEGARRAAFRENAPGLDVSGDHRACNTLSGSFTVHEVAFSAEDGRLETLRLSFEQHCEGALPALRGEITYRYVAPPPEPGPVPAEPPIPVPDVTAPPGVLTPGPLPSLTRGLVPGPRGGAP